MKKNKTRQVFTNKKPTTKAPTSRPDKERKDIPVFFDNKQVGTATVDKDSYLAKVDKNTYKVLTAQHGISCGFKTEPKLSSKTKGILFNVKNPKEDKQVDNKLEKVTLKWIEDMRDNGLKVTHNDIQAFKTGYEFAEGNKENEIKALRVALKEALQVQDFFSSQVLKQKDTKPSEPEKSCESCNYFNSSGSPTQSCTFYKEVPTSIKVCNNYKPATTDSNKCITCKHNNTSEYDNPPCEYCGDDYSKYKPTTDSEKAFEEWWGKRLEGIDIDKKKRDKFFEKENYKLVFLAGAKYQREVDEKECPICTKKKKFKATLKKVTDDLLAMPKEELVALLHKESFDTSEEVEPTEETTEQLQVKITELEQTIKDKDTELTALKEKYKDVVGSMSRALTDIATALDVPNTTDVDVVLERIAQLKERER